MIFPDRNCFHSRIIGNAQIYVQESVKVKEPDLELLPLMSNKAALQKVSLCAAWQPVPPAHGMIC